VVSNYLQRAERPTIYVSQTKSSHQAFILDLGRKKESEDERLKALCQFAQGQIYSQTGQRVDRKEALKKLRRKAGG
jgi:hypothetical protein